jgi:hypothetical protein
MELGVCLLEAAVVQVVEQDNLRPPGRRARRIDVAAAGRKREDRGEHEQGEAPHHSESFRIHQSTPLTFKRV